MPCHHPNIANFLEGMRRDGTHHDGIYLVECKACHEEVAVDFLRLALTAEAPTAEGCFRVR